MIEFMKQLARQAGTIALAENLRLKAADIHTKSSVLDLVTDTDRRVEEFIASELKKRFRFQCLNADSFRMKAKRIVRKVLPLQTIFARTTAAKESSTTRYLTRRNNRRTQ